MTEPHRPTAAEIDWQECMDLLDRLPALAAQDRVAAIERLVRNPSPVIRERALRTGAAVVPDDRLESYLRSDADDVLRNAGMEMLKMRGARGLPLATRLLRDDDDDVVLQAVLALGHLRDLRALEPLRAALTHSGPNVVAAAIEAVGKLGDDRVVGDLLPFLEDDPWLQMAAIQALGDLHSTRALRPLRRLLPDLLVGPLAAEALARIGGPAAFRALADHWLSCGAEGDAETLLGLLAHVIEGLKRRPEPPDGLLESLAGFLHAEEPEARASAARSLLALGPSDFDAEAIEELAGGPADVSIAPACLNFRRDLTADLVARPGRSRGWGFLLAARWPRSIAVADLAAALGSELPSADVVRPARRALERIRSPRLAETLVDLFAALPGEQASTLLPLLATHRDYLRDVLGRREGLDASTRLVLQAQLGDAGDDVVEGVLALAETSRLAVLERVLDVEGVVRRLPWKEWLERDAERYAPLAARAAAEYALTDLLPIFRRLLVEASSPAVVRAVGELGDRESVAALGRLLEGDDEKLAPLVLESLGRIGGPDARAAIRGVLFGGKCESRLGLRALSLCAIEEDDAVFRGAVGHPDWYVRLTCAEVLGRFARPENLAALSQLAADPVAIVSHRALSSLET
jgi:HEAT repeat protein